MKAATRVRDPATHRFGIGEFVSWRGSTGTAHQKAVTTEIIRHLPPLGTDLQYRIKALDGSREHVAIESELSPAGVNAAASVVNSVLDEPFSIAIRRRLTRRT